MSTENETPPAQEPDDTDVLTRLRAWGYAPGRATALEAADEIERLRSPAQAGAVAAAIRSKYEQVKATTYRPGTPAEAAKAGRLQGLNDAIAIAIAMVAEDAHPSGLAGVARKALEAVVSDCNLAASACDSEGPRKGFMHVANDATEALQALAALAPTAGEGDRP